MNNVLGTLINLVKALPFGMKAADTEIAGNDVSDGVTINQQVEQKSVYKDLLKGEVTQEVEELRYSTYKAVRESDNYKYIGGGEAVKKEKSNKSSKIKFTQENKLICSDILTELKRVNSYGVENYTVTLAYNGFPKIKLEKFLESVDVEINDGKKARTTLNFSTIPNKMEFSAKPFVKSLEDLKDAFVNNDRRFIENSDFNTILTMTFTTSDVEDGEFDIVNYVFSIPTLIDINVDNLQYKLIYEWDSYNRNDLTDKFFSKEREEKYKNKERKDYRPNIIEMQQKPKVKCDDCGSEVAANEITAYEGKNICTHCYVKRLLNKQKL